MLELKHISKTFYPGTVNAKTALFDLNLTLNDGDFVTVIGGNLNQIARTLNEWHSPYPQLAVEVRSAASDLAALKFEVLEKVGEAVGNVQAYQL